MTIAEKGLSVINYVLNNYIEIITMEKYSNCSQFLVRYFYSNVYIYIKVKYIFKILNNVPNIIIISNYNVAWENEK